VHKFIRSDSEKYTAGTREARSVFIRELSRVLFSDIAYFTEGHTSFEDLHIAISE
jgi:hypothetical protein